MRKSTYAKNMEGLVKKMFGDLWPQVRLVSVEAKPGTDWTGDDILDVTIVFEGEAQLNTGKAFEMRHAAWLKWGAGEELPPPMFHFLSTEAVKELEAIDLEEVLGPYES